MQLQTTTAHDPGCVVAGDWRTAREGTNTRTLQGQHRRGPEGACAAPRSRLGAVPRPVEMYDPISPPPCRNKCWKGTASKNSYWVFLEVGRGWCASDPSAVPLDA